MITVIVLLALAGGASAQEKVKDGTVSSTDTESKASALLELESNNKGFLPPRLSTAQRDAVTAWAEGSLIYNSTTKTIEYYNGTSWIGFSSAFFRNIKAEKRMKSPLMA